MRRNFHLQQASQLRELRGWDRPQRLYKRYCQAYLTGGKKGYPLRFQKRPRLLRTLRRHIRLHMRSLRLQCPYPHRYRQARLRVKPRTLLFPS